MNSSDAIVMTGNATQLLAEYRKINEAIAAEQRAARESARANREAAQEQANLAREGARIFEQNIRPIEKYKREVDKLKWLLQEGAINQETFNRAMERQRQIFSAEKSATPEARAKAAEAAARAAEREAQSKKALAAEAARAAEAQKQLDLANQRAIRDLEQREAAQKRLNQARDAEAQGIISRNLTAQERFNIAMARAEDLRRRGKLTQEQFNRELAHQNKLLEEATPKVEGFAGKIGNFGLESVAAFTGVGSALAGIMAAATAIKAEYEDIKRRQQEAGQTQKSFAEVVRGVGVGFKPDETMGRGDIEPALRRMMSRSGATEAEAANAFAAALAGKGSGTNEDALRTAEQALRVNRNDADLTRELATRSGLLSNAAGLKDPREAMGLFADMMNTGAVVKPRDVGQSGLAAVTDLLQFGATPETGAELYNTINNLMNDTEGARTHQAAVSLALQMRDYAPGKKDRVPKEQLAAFRAAKTPAEQIAVLRQSPELRKSFLANSNFETKATPAIEQLLSGSATALETEAAVQQGIGAPSAAAFEKYVGGVNALPSHQLAQLGAALDNIVTQYELSDTAGGLAGVIGEKSAKALGKVDFPLRDSWTVGAAEQMFQASVRSGVEPREAAARSIEASYLNVHGESVVNERDTQLLQDIVFALRDMNGYMRAVSNNTAGEAPEAALGKK